MAILRHQVVGTSRKGAVHELVVVRVGSDDAHAEVRINELHILLVENQQDNVLGNGGRNLLPKNFLVLLQNLIGDTEVEAPGEKSILYRTIGTLAGDNLQQAVSVNHYGIHSRLLRIRCTEV